MDYLAYKLAYYLFLAFLVGLGVGWISCSPRTDR